MRAWLNISKQRREKQRSQMANEKKKENREVILLEVVIM